MSKHLFVQITQCMCFQVEILYIQRANWLKTWEKCFAYSVSPLYYDFFFKVYGKSEWEQEQVQGVRALIHRKKKRKATLNCICYSVAHIFWGVVFSLSLL